jgi:uncharacterized cupin superfamily protein
MQSGQFNSSNKCIIYIYIREQRTDEQIQSDDTNVRMARLRESQSQEARAERKEKTSVPVRSEHTII